MSVEVIAMQVAHSLTSRAVQVWLGGRRREQERTLAMGELVRLRIPGLRAQRSVERQFEQIADAVAARLEPLCVYEYPDLDDGGRQAAIDLVVEVFRHANLSDQAIIGADANAAEWARRLRVQSPPHRTLGEPASRFYELLLAECCECYVQILRRLPVFNERAITELLGRVTNLGAELSRILERLPARSLYAPGGSDYDEEFRSEYLGLISRELDEVELFSVFAGPAPRTMLSVAYISLRVTANTDSVSRHKNRSETLLRTGVGSWDEQDVEAATVRVEAALKRSRRTLLLGEAGSGKTTLLSWLAVTAARRGFTGDLAEWNDLVPFLVKLRSYAGRDLPTPDGYLDSTAAPLTGHMPCAWVDRQFKAGRALLMVDGVDELVPAERRKVRDWLRQLLYAYPTTHVVITSRPAAAQSGWLEGEEFSAVSLERMTPTDLRAFIRQWHHAVQARGGELPCAPEDLPHYERSLMIGLQDRPHLQALAASPLLAAMLCALHLDRRRQLPRNRMELYQTALELLVQRRDAERAIPSAQIVHLSLTDKLCVLRDLAWRLSDNNRNELSEDKARQYVTAKVAAMRHLDINGRIVLEHLLGRSGVLRSPEEGRIDFIHRTFQEYLAAAEAAAEDRIGNLVGRAHLDPWRETIIMAAGHSNRSQRIELINGILDRADNEIRHQRSLRLLAASCLETIESIPDVVAQRIDNCVNSLLPPRRKAEATSLALVGEPVLRRLPHALNGLSETAAETIIRVAALIGGDRALTLLSTYTADKRRMIREAISWEWEYFDPGEYARRVLSNLPLEETFLKLTHSSQWPELSNLTNVRRLWIQYPFTSGLDPFANMPALEWLWLTRGIEDNDLSALRHQPTLSNLVLLNGTTLEDASPIAALSGLTNLQIQGWESLPQLAEIPLPEKLTSLGLGRLPVDTDLTQLQSHTRLRSLILESRGKPRGLAVIGDMSDLTSLAFVGFDMDEDLFTVRDATYELRYITLFDCKLPDDLSPLNSMQSLRKVFLENCKGPDGPVNLASLASRSGHPKMVVELSHNQDIRGQEEIGPYIRINRMRH